ncbi:GlxA family transcriptional regulator [Geothrix sp. PMB-07]|uniref:GlxA family transcriptional regulator n=1 Tax=Geothrix sp. PMB-07 TaxID=3068640 RepID=UPI0027425809|nr:GlxA family transcriptional regulator [Geothrix sp. PMB-07]WLT30812.1 GlxA family transcriptional regulator [Geothrix sp. PMB-07]
MARNTTHTLGILAYPGAQLAAVHGLKDLLEAASRLRAQQAGSCVSFLVQVLEGPLEAPTTPWTALLLPPSLTGGALPEPSAARTDWLSARHAEGTVLCSVCAGAFLLAETGLLEGRPATTHWALAERFAGRFPGVALDADRLLIDDGDLITAGGLMAWVDLGLRLVDRYLGSAALLATARYFLVDPGGREQRFYSSFVPPLTHGDAAILKVQHWLQAHSGDKVSVPQLAARAKLGDRTFLRRFQRATGLNPGQYLQRLRVGKARDLLEQSDAAIDEVAWQVGYEDPSAFRRVFHKVMGLSPGEYRRRFAVMRQA